MSDQSLLIYKLMILYMLDNVDFPMTNSQLSEFFVSHGYTTYFQFQEAANEMTDGGFLRAEVVRNTTRYYMMDRGREALSLFTDSIPDAFKEDILNYFQEKKYQLRREVEITADYYPLKGGEYMVDASIREKGSLLLSLSLNVVSKEQAVLVCDRWKETSDEVYQSLIRQLLL